MAKNNTHLTLKKIPTNRSLGALLFDKPHDIHSHEIESLEILRRFGYLITRISPSRIPNIKTPDIKWQNELWEIKTITGSSRDNIIHALSAAKKQSSSVILHIRKTKRNPKTILGEISAYFWHSRTVKRILVTIGNEYCILSKQLVK